MKQKYDTIIIGAGMSGLAAGIRLAMYGKKVVILEKHFISGGLNSYYQRGKRKFDVGLHAMTNFVEKGTKAKPLTKLLKQLRIRYEELELSEQSTSLIKFKSESMHFSNDFELLTSEVAKKFPHEIDGFIKFVKHIEDFNEVALDNETFMAKDVARNFLKDNLLIEMIFAPLLIYGSAWENDMDFSQFVIMFKSIYLEGFCRPDGGVRTVINLLLKKYEELGGELRFKAEVSSIDHRDGKIQSVTLKNGDILETEKVISSMGHPETMAITGETSKGLPEVGPLTFCESILCLDKRPADLGINETIIFYNDSDIYEYKSPQTFYDNRSAVICFPNNFKNDTSDEGIARVTYIANYKFWKELERKEYLAKKEILAQDSFNTIKSCFNQFEAKVLFKDVFTPTTIERYTGHFGGTVYGSTDKLRNGKTHIEGLYLCGTDQGFLGIVGSMLSGISMANLHGLME
ncbi:NAD(P)/FAD-dependent oxidoreductase [Bacteriovorax sp. Seq25_V]|uniref:phytoene desaturase family protein n=1 Tax=Bacteriovorax sp. Seq25_V TaxID=1201288 RepID=UPI00038A2719|nr:NAD(P)/FAD-dependent oxidoreductase [Bacteriovorax sp. Seq25_V]EQC44926.1 NAD(P)-binding Rossmann-like domain protein [Bacteriovorax sp. Seq25_V]